MLPESWTNTNTSTNLRFKKDFTFSSWVILPASCWSVSAKWQACQAKPSHILLQKAENQTYFWLHHRHQKHILWTSHDDNLSSRNISIAIMVILILIILLMLVILVILVILILFILVSLIILAIFILITSSMLHFITFITITKNTLGESVSMTIIFPDTYQLPSWSS